MALGKNIKGITIQLEGDSTPLQKALKDVDQASNKTVKELGQINRALKFDEGNTTLIAQKQEVLQEAIQTTSKRLEALKSAQKDVESQFQSGKIDASQYREFQREIEKTESDLKSFKKQADTLKAKVNVQADTSKLSKAKSDIRELGTEAKKAGREIGQHISQGAAVGAAGLGALTVGMSDTNKQLSRLESQATMSLSSVNKIANNVKQVSDEQLAAMEQSFSAQESAMERSFDKQLRAIEKNYDAQEKALDEMLENEMSALEKTHDEKLKMINEEYQERLKLIDEEEYRRLKAIDEDIKKIEDEQAAVDKANKKEEENKKRLELQERVRTAKTVDEKQKAIEDLNEFEKKVADDLAREKRRAEIDNLKSQKDVIKESSDEQRKALQDDYELKVSQVNSAFEVEKKSLEKLHDQKRDQFQEQKEIYLANVQEQFDAELEMFKSMNQQKLQYASTPVVSTSTQQVSTKVNLDVSDFEQSRIIFDSVNQDVDQAVEALGNLVRAGYETEESLTEISKGIAGAIQLYGDTFNAESLAESITTTTQLGEATGQLSDLIEKSGGTIEGFNAQLQQYTTVGERADFITKFFADNGLMAVYDQFAQTNPEIVRASEANIAFKDALSELTITLTPLITAITEILTKIIEWANENPLLTQTIAVLMGIVSAISAVFAVLSPIISTIVKILPSLSKFLGTVGRAFTAVLGPIGLVIAIVTTVISLAKLIISNWEPIKGFFKNLWDGITSAFQAAVGVIGKVAQTLLGIIKAPINAMIKLLNVFIRGINKIKIPDWVPAIGGMGFHIPEIPMLAKGTNYFKGGYAIVGEQGPELVQMPTGAKVNTAKETANMLSGDTITITIQNMNVRDDNDIVKISRDLNSRIQQSKMARGVR